MNEQLMTEKPKLLSGSGTIENVEIENSTPALTEALKKHGLTRGLAVVWQMQDVCWGRVENGQLVIAGGGDPTPEYWQELRLFNADAELHLTRIGDKLSGRFRSDAEGTESVRYIDATSPLWGVRDKDQNGVPKDYVRLSDYGRGIEMIVPDDVEGTPEQYALITRNYVEADKDTKQAGYADYRFAGVVAARKGV